MPTPPEFEFAKLLADAKKESKSPILRWWHSAALLILLVVAGIIAWYFFAVDERCREQCREQIEDLTEQMDRIDTQYGDRIDSLETEIRGYRELLSLCLPVPIIEPESLFPSPLPLPSLSSCLPRPDMVGMVDF